MDGNKEYRLEKEGGEEEEKEEYENETDNAGTN